MFGRSVVQRAARASTRAMSTGTRTTQSSWQRTFATTAFGAGVLAGAIAPCTVDCSVASDLGAFTARIAALEKHIGLPSGGDTTGEDAKNRTLRFVLSMAAEKAGVNLAGGFKSGNGYLFKLDSAVTGADIAKLNAAMTSIIADDQAITSTFEDYPSVLAGFKANPAVHSFDEKLLKSRVQHPVHITESNGHTRLFQGSLFASTGGLSSSDYKLQKHGDLVALSFDGSDYAADAGMEGSLLNVAEWGKAMSVSCVGDVNELQEVGRGRKDYILSAEFRQEGKIQEIVHEMLSREAAPGSGLKSKVRVIAIAGPTSSGKTTFATKLTQYLRNAGMPAAQLTVDHYYLPLDRQPRYQQRQQRSDCDYDHIESMDVSLVNDHIMALIDGQEINSPVYNMKTGFRDPPGHRFAIPEGGILVIEGIHALNPSYTSAVPADQVFKVFLCPLTGLAVDETSTIDVVDARLLRRMSRDYLFRGHSASRTLQMWSNVQRGEKQWIFPFLSDADFVMNSSHEYELCVLKPFVEPLLKGVQPEDPNFDKAQSLLRMLENFNTWSDRDVPTTSLLREFIGNGAYDEH